MMRLILGFAGASLLLAAGSATMKPAELPSTVTTSLKARTQAEALDLEPIVPARVWPASVPQENDPSREAAPALPERRLYPMLPKGSFVGVLELTADWRDARGQTVPRGVYTLRYAVQPLIKDHLGTAAYRDFLLLAPAASDRGEDYTQEEVVELSRWVTGSRHPAVLDLAPAPEADGLSLPRLAGDTQVVFRIEIGQLVLGLVFPGR